VKLWAFDCRPLHDELIATNDANNWKVSQGFLDAQEEALMASLAKSSGEQDRPACAAL
jgi:hypothetical protein